MQEITVTRRMDNPDSAQALDAALRTALGSNYGGFIHHNDTFRLLFEEYPDDSAEKTARELIQNFDMTTRTEAQLQAAADSAQRAAFKESAASKIEALQTEAAELGKSKDANEVIPVLIDHIAELTELVKQLL